MDFIPKICVSKKSKHSKSGGSKLSLRSRKQFSLSQSQSYTQDSEVTEGSSNQSFSQPMPNLESIAETDAVSTEQPTQDDIFTKCSLDSCFKLGVASNSQGEKTAKKEMLDLFKLSPDSPPNLQSPTLEESSPEEIQVIDLVSTPEEDEVMQPSPNKSETQGSPKKNHNLVGKETVRQSTQVTRHISRPKKKLSVIEEEQSPEKNEKKGRTWQSPEKDKKDLTQQSPKKNIDLVEKEIMWQSPKKNEKKVTWQSPEKNLNHAIGEQSPKKNKKDLTQPSPKKDLSLVEKEQSPEKIDKQARKQSHEENKEDSTQQSPKKNLSLVEKEQSPEKIDKQARKQSPEKTKKDLTHQSPKKNTTSKPDLDKIKLLKGNREASSAAEPRKSKKSKCSVETSGEVGTAVERSDIKSKFVSKLQVFSKPEAKKLTLLDADTEQANVNESGGTENMNESGGTENVNEFDGTENVNESMDYFMDKPDSKEEASVVEKQSTTVPARDKSDRMEEATIAEKQSPSTDVPVESKLTDELPCPICNKFAGKNRRAHMKSCAVKNYVSTKQLLQAIELQEKQAAERRALGLPPSGLQANQKVFVKKKSSGRGPGKDAGVELALALSKSLQEAQEQEELRRVREMIGEQEAFGWQATASQAELVANAIAPEPQPSTSGAQLVLGPDTDGVVQLRRGSANTARRGRGRNVPGPPPLLLTTKDEERERRITEKVAMLLLGDENTSTSDAAERLPKPPLSSRLRKLQSESSTLWSLTAVSPSKTREAFYVPTISEFVSPTKHEPGAALRHLSQIPGRNKTPSKTPEVYDMSLCSFVESNAWVPPASTSMDTSATPTPKVSPERCKKEGNALASAWRGLLNNRTLSDVTVYVRGEHALRAHKLVLYARCPAMLEDIAKELSPGSDRVCEQMLLWSDVSRAAALAMLEFIYCDTTERATTLLQDDLQLLTQLARRYRVKELLQHLLMLTKIRSCVGAKEAESPSRNTFPKPHSSPSLTPKKPRSIEKTPENSPASTSSGSVFRPRSNSPDLFTEEGDQEESSLVEYERPDIEYLVSMMEKSQVEKFNASTQSISSSLTSPNTVEAKKRCSDSFNLHVNSSNNVEAKRKCSASPNLYATLSKKHCKDACRKKLSLDLVETNHSFHMDLEQSPSHSRDGLRKKLGLDPVEMNESSRMEVEKSPSHGKDICRKKLSLDPMEVNHSFHMNMERSSSQILDLLEKSPSSKFNSTLESEVETFRTAETDEGSPIISDVWDGFEDYGFEPLMPPRLSEARKSLMLAKSPDTVISISSTTVSQNSTSPGNVTVRERVLDDSLDAFEGIDLSGLERAALNAYEKVVSPLPALNAYAKVVSPLPTPPAAVATPVQPASMQENAVTPMADYSIMESPALERELDKYGIRRLRRNQAKLILRHIYNELHPMVPATPAATNSHVSPVSRRGTARAPRARGRRGGTATAGTRVDKGRKVHDMSMSQPDPDHGDEGEHHHIHNMSLSQPLVNNRSSESDSSASSSNDSGEEDGLTDLDDDEFGVDRPGKLETAEEVKETMSRLIVSDPELHHRLLMYEPIMLVELQSLLKKNGKRCNPRLLLDYLDEHCITFRTPRPPRRQGTQRRKKRSPHKAAQRGSRGRGRPKVRPTEPIN